MRMLQGIIVRGGWYGTVAHEPITCIRHENRSQIVVAGA